MKKILSFLLIFTLLQAMAIPHVFAASETDIFRLQALGVIDEYVGDKAVTRAEAVNAFVHMIMSNVGNAGQTGFADVSADHKYAGAIFYAKQMGIINGADNSNFNPDNPATGMQIAKMAVVTLGYQKNAEQAGGYEKGYLETASRLGLLTGYSLYDEVTMSELCVLLDKMLDMTPLEPVYGSSDEYKTGTDTIYDKLIAQNDKILVEGILSAVGGSAINGADALEDGEISVAVDVSDKNGNSSTVHKVFNCKLDVFSYLGKRISAYYVDTGRARPIIESISADEYNKELSVKNEDIQKLSKVLCVYDDENKTHNAKISDRATFIYNGSNYTAEDEIKLNTGDVRLVDNDGNNVFDIVFIDEYESFIVDRISKINTSLFFKSDAKFRGKSSFKFDFNDEDYSYYICDSDNNKISFDAIEAENIVSIKASANGFINHISVSDKIIDGTIKEIYSDNKITIDDAIYELYVPNASDIYQKCSVGYEGKFYLNSYDEIVECEINSENNYGYVVAARDEKGVSSKAQIKIVSPATSKKDVEVSGDIETIYYTYLNGDMQILELADKIKYTGKLQNGNMVHETRVSASDIDKDYLANCVVAYKQNSEGQVIGLYVTQLTGDRNSYNFNGELNSFGGISGLSAFFVKSVTDFICIPESGNFSDDDFYVEVDVTDGLSYSVVPINIDEKTQIAECCILRAKMNADELKPIDDSVDYSIVGKVSQALSENGEFIYKLEVLTGNEVETPYAEEGSNVEAVVSKLRCGDIIRYNTNAKGQIANIKKVASMYEYDNIYSVSSSGLIYGLVSDIEINRLDDFENEMVDRIYFNNLGGLAKNYKLFRDENERPMIYSYDKSDGAITVAEIEEVITENEAGDDASKVFMIEENNLKGKVVKLVVIFKD